MIFLALGSLAETVLWTSFAQRDVVGHDPFLVDIMLARPRVGVCLLHEAFVVNRIDMELLHLISPKAELAHSVVALPDDAFVEACGHALRVVLHGARARPVLTPLAWMVVKPLTSASAERF